jgi:siroheme synthase (precorrin-2 oxidase/ferrochelatase)
MEHGVRRLCSMAGLEDRDEVELAGVVRAVAATTERHHAERVVTAAERAGDEVSRVDTPRGAARQAGASRHPGALRR